MKNSLLLFLLLTTFSFGFANTTITIKKTIIWQEAPIIHNPTGNFPINIWAFEGASYSDMYPSLPLFSERTPVSSNGKASARLINAKYESFDKEASADDDYLSENITVNTKVFNDRGKYFLYYNLIPIRKTGSGTFERLTSFEIVLDFEESTIGTPRTDYTYNSEFSDGMIYKIAVTETGMHKITYDFLKNTLGISIDEVNPDKIRILGNGGGMLPELINDSRYDDLEELAIQITGDDDGQFNNTDYILFYAEGPDKWYYNENNQEYNRPKNVYSTENYYFIKIGSEDGLRISSQSSVTSTDHTTTEFDGYERFEEEKFNLLNEALGAQGSGRYWYGDPFNPTRERVYNFTFPNIKLSDPVNLKVAFAGRSKSSSSFKVAVSGQEFSESIGSANFASNESTYAYIKHINQTFSASSNDISITVKYPSVGDGTNTGWLDYIELNTRNNLSKISDQLLFRDHKSMDFNTTTFQVSNVNGNTLVWDITDPLKPVLQESTTNGSTLTFGAVTQDLLKEYVAFEPSGNYPVPVDAGVIENQNIHAIEDIHLAIIYHKDFEEAALRLADHRRSFSGLDVATVDITHVFNEFGCGRRDVTAIRDFAKMLYDRSPDKFRYLLLFGDGSFDFKDITTQGMNFIPPFETKESLNPIRGFPSDDFFGLLTENEGPDLIGALDIAVGRIPARTAVEANVVTQKIIDYDSSPSTIGDWRNRLTFNADDEDNDVHLTQADRLGEIIRNGHRVKIFK